MLQQIRDRTTGLIAGFIIAIVAVPFAFFGIQSFSGSGGDKVVAKVGGEKIHASALQRAYDQRYQQLASLMGENFKPDQIQPARLRAAVLKNMTQESMLRQFTQSAGYMADDASLFKAISGDSAFQRDGKFSSDAYKQVLSGAGYTPARYESQLRASLAMEQMRDTVIDTEFSPDVETKQAMALIGEERTFEYALFEPARYHQRVQVSDEDVKARYDETASNYQSPERIKLAYVELSRNAIKASEPAQDVLKALYDAEKSGRFSTPGERRASHILIAFGADKKAALEKAKKIEQQLKDGADFAKLAKEDSDDPGSKDAGGDLGWIKRGQMTRAFEDALFSLPANTVSDPVETEFGYHLIRVDDIKPATTRPFDDPDVQKQLVTLFQNRERQKSFDDMSSKLEQLAFENPTSLQPVADALGLQIKTTDWFTRGTGDGIAADTAINTAAFSPEVLVNDENSKPIPHGGDALVVIRKADYEAAHQKNFEEVADQVRESLVDERARAMAQQDAEETLNAVKSGTAFQDIVVAKGGELRNPGAIHRDDKKVEAAVVEEVYRMPRPAKPDTASYAIAKLKDGGDAVLKLTQVSPPETYAADDVARVRDQLTQLIAGDEFRAYMQMIENDVGVEVMESGSDDDTTPAATQ